MNGSVAAEWRTPEEVAAELKVPVEAVEKLIAEKRLAAVRVGDVLRIRSSAVERYLERADLARPRRAWVARAGVGAAVAGALAFAVMAIAADPPGWNDKVPRKIPYRGVLAENGSAVQSGSLPMLFELFTDRAGGTRLWSERQTVAVQDGQFSVLLGDATTNGIPASVFGNPNVFLAVTVNEQPLAGRQQLLSVPYTRRAEEVDSVPPGAVMFFNLSACPAGWVLLDAARGRAIVGAGTVGHAVGSPLGDGEDRQHSHWIDHNHGVAAHTTDGATITGSVGRNAFGYNDTGAFVTDTSTDEVIGQFHHHRVGDLTTGGASSQWASNSLTSNVIPYLQLRVCQKQ